MKRFALEEVLFAFVMLLQTNFSNAARVSSFRNMSSMGNVFRETSSIKYIKPMLPKLHNILRSVIQDVVSPKVVQPNSTILL